MDKEDLFVMSHIRLHSNSCRTSTHHMPLRQKQSRVLLTICSARCMSPGQYRLAHCNRHWKRSMGLVGHKAAESHALIIVVGRLLSSCCCCCGLLSLLLLLLQLLMRRSLGNLSSTHAHAMRLSQRAQCKSKW